MSINLKLKYVSFGFDIICKKLNLLKIKSFLKIHTLFFMYVFFQLLVVFFGLMNENVIGSSFNKIDVSYAVLIHFLTLLFFILGYLSFHRQDTFKFCIKNKLKIDLSKGFLWYSIFFVGIGLLTSVATIVEVIPPMEYLNLLFSGDTKKIIQIRNQAGASGLPGILKMLNYLPLSIFLVVNGIVSFYDISLKNQKKIDYVIFISLLACLLKVFFSLDRLTLMAILLVLIYRYFLDKKINIKAVFLCVLVFTVLAIITSLRMNKTSILEFIIVYFKLSIVNFQLVLDNQTDWSYGFNTFLMPLAYIFKFFGVENFSVVGPEKYTVDPAQYFASNLYIDFGYFFFIGFYLMGIFVRRLQIKSISGASYYPQIYFIVLFALASFVSVPIIRGVEFWVMLLLAYLYNKFIKFI